MSRLPNPKVSPKARAKPARIAIVTTLMISVSIWSWLTAMMPRTTRRSPETTPPNEEANSIPEFPAASATARPANWAAALPRIRISRAATMLGR
jgi:hypothetical protein